MTDRSISEDTELAPRLSRVAASDLHALYLTAFEGYAGLDTVSQWTQNPQEDRPFIAATRHALDSAFLDLRLLARVVDGGEPTRAAKPPGLSGDLVEEIEQAREVRCVHILAELYWRIRDGWEAAAPEARAAAIAGLRLLRIDEREVAPLWSDLLDLLNEIESLNHDMGDGDVVTGSCAELVLRFQAAGSKKERLARPRTTPARGRLPPRKPPPAELIDAKPPVRGVARVVAERDSSLGSASIPAKVEGLLEALVSRELLLLMPSGSVVDLADRFSRALLEGRAHALPDLADWLLDQDDVDELFFEDEQLATIATELERAATGPRRNP
jgi:hypothetical protein